MINYYLSFIPDDILYYYVWPNISNNIKMLLKLTLFVYLIILLNYFSESKTHHDTLINSNLVRNNRVFKASPISKVFKAYI